MIELDKKSSNWQKQKILQSKQHQLYAYQTINELVVAERNKKRITLIDGKMLTEFLSCSYLGLDQDERLIEASAKHLHRTGINFAVSRTRLRMKDSDELEDLLNQIFLHGFSTTFSSLHVAHLGVLPLLSTGECPSFPIQPQGVMYVIDKFSHNSLQICRGVMEQLGDVEVIDIHDDSALETLLHNINSQHKTPLVVCDGVYSMGGLAPIKKALKLLEKYDGYLYTDDAHGISVFGKQGCGFVLEDIGYFHPRLILAVSLSKGFGSNGAAIVMPTSEDSQFIKRFCSTYIFGNPMAQSLISASIASAKIHLSDELSQLQKTLRDRIILFDATIAKKESVINYHSASPIRGLFIGDEYKDIECTTKLREQGFAVSAAMYPTVAKGKSIIRVSLSVDHTENDIIGLCEALNLLI